MSHLITKNELYDWCRVDPRDLENHPKRKTPFKLVKDSSEMGEVMARTLVDEIQIHNKNTCF